VKRFCACGRLRAMKWKSRASCRYCSGRLVITVAPSSPCV
jgi:hypothetical protein